MVFRYLVIKGDNGDFWVLRDLRERERELDRSNYREAEVSVVLCARIELVCL